MSNHSPEPWQIDIIGKKASEAMVLAAPMMREALKRVMVECGGALSTKTYHFVVLAIGQAEGRS